MSLDPLFEQLKHPNPHLQDRAIQELAEADDPNTIPRLMEILDDEDVSFRRSAVKALGRMGTNAIDAVVNGLNNGKNPTIRVSCAKAISQIAHNDPDLEFPANGLDALKNAIADPNPIVNMTAVMALGEMGDTAFEILSTELSTTDNPAVAVAIINAIASRSDEKTIEILTQISQDETVDTYVRESAQSGLSRADLLKGANG